MHVCISCSSGYHEDRQPNFRTDRQIDREGTGEEERRKEGTGKEGERDR